ncbi:hypothetical protein DFH09DRAFT_1354722 [Mycena vulgaris]|nr:hypothetical protein DFH09DRAFT_1354722 [Mycena vulgaris]
MSSLENEGKGGQDRPRRHSEREGMAGDGVKEPLTLFHSRFSLGAHVLGAASAHCRPIPRVSAKHDKLAIDENRGDIGRAGVRGRARAGRGAAASEDALPWGRVLPRRILPRSFPVAIPRHPAFPHRLATFRRQRTIGECGRRTARVDTAFTHCREPVCREVARKGARAPRVPDLDGRAPRMADLDARGAGVDGDRLAPVSMEACGALSPASCSINPTFLALCYCVRTARDSAFPAYSCPQHGNATTGPSSSSSATPGNPLLPDPTTKARLRELLRSHSDPPDHVRSTFSALSDELGRNRKKISRLDTELARLKAERVFSPISRVLAHPSSTVSDPDRYLCLVREAIQGAKEGQVKWTHPFLTPLQPLASSAALKTFIEIADDGHEESVVKQLLELTGNLPLAISLIAHVGAHEGCEMTLARWKAESTRVLSDGYDKKSSLDISIMLSLSSPRMTQAAQDLLRILNPA